MTSAALTALYRGADFPARLRLLRWTENVLGPKRITVQTSAGPLMALDQLASHQTALLRRLRELGTRVLVLGLLPLDQTRFPGSPDYFKSVNERLREVSIAEGAEFFDWAAPLATKGTHAELFFRDTFHPNEAGARALAEILRERFCRERSL